MRVLPIAEITKIKESITIKINFKHIHQSPWLGDYLNNLSIDDSQKSFLEIGVGIVISSDCYNYPEKYQNIPWNQLPVLGSNTIELLQNGWIGYYIDPVPEFVEQAVLLAPDKNKIFTKAVGCGLINETKILNKGESFLSNTPSDEPWIGKEYIIQNTTEALDSLMVDSYIDFFSLDVEGFEIQVLQALDFSKYKFNIIFVEYMHSDPDLRVIDELLADKGYVFIRRDKLNALYINKDKLK
tara:strand:+ start:5480 stop:6202 length:723 start_codon:yes stop_codon:yes gene_type:complete